MCNLEELCKASKDGDVDSIRRLVAEGVDVNGLFNFTTPLSCAIQGKSHAAMSALINSGATIYCSSERNREYLLSKIRTNSDLAQKLYDSCGNILHKIRYTTLDDSMNDFYTACINGNLRKAKQLFESGNIDLSKCRSGRKTVLSQSAYNGHLEVVKFLVANGASIEPDNNSYSPLHDAAARGHVEVVKFLVDAGADINALYNGLTPLMEAARTGQLEVVRWLIEVGEVDPDFCVSDSTALITAIESRRLIHVQDNVIEYLIRVSAW